MNRLTRVEVRRIWARRVVLLTVLATTLLSLMALYAVAFEVGSIDERRAEAQEWYEQAVADWERSQEPEQIEQCLEDQAEERERSGDPNLEFGCEWPAPRIEDFDQGPTSLVDVYNGLFSTLVYPVLFLAILLGSTAVAAEFTTGAIGTWLTFEPRRDLVYTSKVLAAAITVVPMALAFVALVLLGTAAVFRFEGVDAALTTQQWTDRGWMAARSVLLAAVAGAVGAALGFLLRHTGAVLAVVAGGVLAVESVLVPLVPGLQRWSLNHNLQAWLMDGTEWSTYDCLPNQDECVEVVHRLSLAQGAGFLTLLTVVALLLAWWVFRRRDVT